MSCLAHWLRWGLTNFLPGRITSNRDPPHPHLLSSWYYSVSHHGPPYFIFLRPSPIFNFWIFEGLKQPKFIILQVWRLEIQDEFWQGLFLSVACTWPATFSLASSHGHSFVHTSLVSPHLGNPHFIFYNTFSIKFKKYINAKSQQYCNFMSQGTTF
jgi:hypothetical protein